MIEVECKALVPEDQVERIKTELTELTKGCTFSKQTNHYFQGSRKALLRLGVLISPYIDDKQFERIRYFASTDLPFSVRTRVDDVTGYEIVIKHGSNAHNGGDREELSITFMPYELDNPSLPVWSTSCPDIYSERVDTLVLCAGFEYLSKWSRERLTYELKKERLTYCLDRNSGYGWVLEVERMEEEGGDIETARSVVEQEIKNMGLPLLDPALLEQMFEYYNENWVKFYGRKNTIWEDEEFQAALDKHSKLEVA